MIRISLGATLLMPLCWMLTVAQCAVAARPNILVAIADDQSFPHTSAYGDRAIHTPAFDRVAAAGVLFRNAFTPAPGCSPMRAAFLTGREIWQLREAGTHASSFPLDLPVFPQQLAAAGYHVGMTGKGWGPGNAIGWPHNPAGVSYGRHKMKSPPGISNNDYAANFADFLEQRQPDQPFCFWFGAAEPHRGYEPGIGAQNGIELDRVSVPGFLPDDPAIRSDIADYLFEIQWFDQHLGKMLDHLEQAGQLDNTLVIVTSDNGMPFPRAKANLYEFGIHMPLAICWPQRIAAGQDTDQLVSLIDVTRTIFAAAEVSPQQVDQLSGHDLLPSLTAVDGASGGTPQSPARHAVFSGRERHSSSRYNSLGYPCRCIRTATHLYIRNLAPQRWPAGTPQQYSSAIYGPIQRDASGGLQQSVLLKSTLGPQHGGYHDIDDGPTLQWMIANRDQPQVAALLAAAVDRRPAEELYDVGADPACLNNLATDPKHQLLRQELSSQLDQHLTHTGDLRHTDPVAGRQWETYPRYSSLRWFPKPDWANEDPESDMPLEWLEQRRPRDKD